MRAAQLLSHTAQLTAEVRALGQSIAEYSTKVSASYLEALVREGSGANSHASEGRRVAEQAARAREAEDRRWKIGAAGALERWESAQRRLASAITSAADSALATSTSPSNGMGVVARISAELLRTEFDLRVLKVDVARSELGPLRIALRRSDARLADAKAQVGRGRNRAEREAAGERCAALREKVLALQHVVEAKSQAVERDVARARTLEAQLDSGIGGGTSTEEASTLRWLQ